MTLTEPQIRRYARHVLLPDVGGTGQARLLAATVALDLDADPAAAIVEATYLAAAGVGRLELSGSRTVTAADVRAGIALAASDVGRPLPDAVAARLRELNPDCTLRTTYETRSETGTSSSDTATALVEGGRRACARIHAIATGAA